MSTITAHAAPSISRESLQLTRRGRVVVFVAALLVTLGALVLAVVPSVVATDAPGTPVQATEVTVQPGDTLWDIATAANPGGDIGETVDEIAKLNAITDGQLRVGEQIAVPTY
jgi:LysM repeat protein